MDLRENDLLRFWFRVNKNGKDGCWIWKDYISNGYGYFYLSNSQHPIEAHRISYEINVGTIPNGMLIDHICKVKTCVNPDHLRLSTPAQNTQYQDVRSNNTTGHKGVSTRGDKFVVNICRNGLKEYLGTYAIFKEACEAYDQRAIELANGDLSFEKLK